MGNFPSKAVTSSWVFRTFSRYCTFRLESSSQFLLALKARNNPPRSFDSDVSSGASEIVIVGILNDVKDTGDRFALSLHEPAKVVAIGISTDEESRDVVVGKGSIPSPGTSMELAEVDPVMIVFSLDAVTLVEDIPSEFFDTVWPELVVMLWLKTEFVLLFRLDTEAADEV